MLHYVHNVYAKLITQYECAFHRARNGFSKERTHTDCTSIINHPTCTRTPLLQLIGLHKRSVSLSMAAL
jgi:hypothetical protein